MAIFYKKFELNKFKTQRTQLYASKVRKLN